MPERFYKGGHPFLPYSPERPAVRESLVRAEDFYRELDGRRSVRAFSRDPVPRSLIAWAIRSGSTAPSGAHRQPWRFVAVSDPGVKRRIREAAEAEERESYAGRMPEEWLAALAPIGTGPDKPYLEHAPWLVVVFAERFGLEADGARRKNYYVTESVGIACGMFIAALHHMGLATLTHTPSPMGFLSEILGRPANEQPTILFPVGWPASDAQVPDLRRKPLGEVAEWVEAQR